MLPILEFIFSSFWIWAGTVVLVTIIGASLMGMRLVSWVYKIQPEHNLLRQLVKNVVKERMSDESVKILEKLVLLADIRVANKVVSASGTSGSTPVAGDT